MSSESNLVFHSGLARERELLHADFANVLREVLADELTHRVGLPFLGQRYGGAAWEVGNCLLLIRRESPSLTEARLFMYTGAYPDDAAERRWCALIRFWSERAWLNIPDLRIPVMSIASSGHGDHSSESSDAGTNIMASSGRHG